MTPVMHHDAAKLAALGAGALFIGDLFPTWQPAGGSGWDDWGIAAGALALVVLWLITARIERPRAAVVAATGLLAATGLGLNNGGTRWPAWLGLALAVLTVAACLEAYRTAPARRRRDPAAWRRTTRSEHRTASAAEVRDGTDLRTPGAN